MSKVSAKDVADLYLTMLSLPFDSVLRLRAGPLLAEMRSQIADHLCVEDEVVQNAFELVAQARWVA